MSIQIEIIKFIQSFGNSFFDLFFEFLTLFGEETILVLIASFIFLSVDKNKGYKLIFTIASGTCFNALIKNIVKFERPIGIEGIVSKRVETATGYSFPSGHTQATATFWTSLSLIFKNKKLYIFSAVLVTLVAFSRVYLGVHWPTDVIFAVIFGVLWSAVVNKVFNYIQKNKSYKLLLGSALIFAILTFIIGDDDFYKSSGLLLGLSLGYVIEDKYINLSIDMLKGNKSITYALLLVGLLIIKSLLKLVFPNILIFSMIRYFLVGFWAFGITPIIAKKLENRKIKN